MCKKQLFLFSSILLLISLITLSWLLLWPKYQNYRAIRFLDDQFHILKSRDTIIEVENLKLHEKYKHRYDGFFVWNELWVTSSNVTPINKLYRFPTNTKGFHDLEVLYLKKDNPSAKEIRAKLIHILHKLPTNDFDLIWDLNYDGKTFHIVFRSTSIEDDWEGYVLWISTD